MNKQNKRLLIFINEDWAFHVYNRDIVAKSAISCGYEVIILAKETGNSTRIKNEGFKFIPLKFERGKGSVRSEIELVLDIYNNMKSTKPALVLFIGFKLIFLGTLAKFFLPKSIQLLGYFTGLGTLFTSEKSSLFSLNKIVRIIYKIVFDAESHLIFQNLDDLEVLSKIIPNTNNYTIIRGSGVDIQTFPFTPLPQANPKIILFVGRIIKEKGVIELINAAKRLKSEYFNKIKFRLVGSIDTQNPTGISERYLKQELVDNYIEWSGFTNDIISELQNSFIVVLPSYREGLPKSLIEACSIGRPIVTTNVAGCKDVVINGINGILIESKNAEALASAIETLLLNPDKCKYFAQKSRLKAESDFSIEIVYSQFEQIWNKFG